MIIKCLQGRTIQATQGVQTREFNYVDNVVDGFVLAGEKAEAFGQMRFFNVYGPGQDGRFLLSYLVDCLKTGKTAGIKHPASSRDYLFITDAVSAVVKALRTRAFFAVYNIGTGRASSVREIVERLEKITGRRLKIRKHKAPEDPYPYVQADISRAKKDLKWKPLVSLSDGLGRMVHD